MRGLIAGFDWSRTPLGPLDSWGQSLKTVVRVMLGSRFPMFVWWGPAMVNIYNDAYAPMLGKRHPSALGQSAFAVWEDVWPVVGPQAEAVLREGRSFWNEELLLLMERNRYLEEAYFTFSYSPVVDDDGGIGGVFCTVTEDTARVLGRRRLRTLHQLSERSLEQGRTVAQTCRAVAETLAEAPQDFSFALIYLLADDGRELRLAEAVNVPVGSPAAPARLDFAGPADVWQIRRALATGKIQEVETRTRDHPSIPAAAWGGAPTEQVMVLPLARFGVQEHPAGFLVAGLSPRRKLDEDYRRFLGLVAGHIATGIFKARAAEHEQRRIAELAALDEAKTVFFSNVSHEFRTPMTLMLGPLEEVLAGETALSTRIRSQVEMVYRNCRRLLKLVNSLLDFSRLEAGRLAASYEPTDLAAVTADLAALFRSALERGGLRLVVDCPPLPAPAYVDREMWEKIVLNLLSNAFKFTLHGEVSVALGSADGHVKLTVRDSGVGIPAEDQDRIFQRFHRVPSTQGRSLEGSGIGLSMVREMVRLHGGTIAVQSTVGRGSTFLVTLPLGHGHLPADRVRPTASAAPDAGLRLAYVDESLRWLDHTGTNGVEVEADDESLATEPAASAVRAGPRPVILVADDNSDVREYLVRLLRPAYEVVTAADGEAALTEIGRRRPDLVLADVMMPRLDGFGLLRTLRAGDETRVLPLILLSARAGETARIEGLAAGADDYVVKPFSARELRARVESQLNLARVRREAERALQAANARLEERVVERTQELVLTNRQLRQEMATRRQAEENLQSFNSRLLLLAAAVQELTSARELGTVCRITRSAARRLVGADGITLVLREGDQCHYVDEEAIAPLWKGQRFPLTACVSGWVMIHREPAIIEDIYADPRVPVAAYRPTFVKSLAMFPLQQRDPVGAIGCYWAQPHRPLPQDVQLMTLLGEAAGRAIESARCYVELETRLTAQRLAQKSLEENRRLFEAVIQTQPTLVVLCDPQGRILLFNRACEELTGYGSDEVQGRTIAELFLPPEWVPVVARRFADPFAPEVRQPHRNPWRTKSGALRLIEWRCTVLPSPVDGTPCLLGTGIDVTDIERMGEQLSESEQQFRLMVQSVKDYALFMLDPRGHVIRWNDGAVRLNGYTADEIMGRHYSVFFPPDPANEGLPERELAEALREGRVETEGWRVRKDGTRYWAHVIITPVLDAEGGHRGFVKVTRDVTERRAAEERLRQANESLRSIFNAAPVALLGIDLEGRITHWSEGAVRMFGWTEAEAVGRICPTVPEEGLTDFLAMVTRVATTGAEELQRVRQKKSGERILARINPAPLRDPAGRVTGVMVVLVDVTERERAAAEIRASEARYRSLFDSINEGFCIIEVLFDDRQKPVDYRFLEVNPAFERQTGLVSAQGRRMRELAPRHEEHWFEIYGRIALTGEPASFQHRAEQLHRWYDVRAYRIGAPEQHRVAILFNDITAQKNMHDKLVESERRLQMFLSFNPAVVFIKDPDGRYLTVNDAFETRFGLSAGRVLGKTDAELFDPAQAEAFAANDRAVLAAGHAIEFEETASYADGDHVSIVAKFPLRDHKGRIYAVGGIATDITVQRRAAEQMRDQATFIADVLDSLTAHVAVINREGKILAVNDAWRRFAAENSAVSPNAFTGGNYLDVCRQAARAGIPPARHVLDGIEAVINGRQSEFLTEYPCHSPDRQRWFRMHVSPLKGAVTGAVIAHEDITVSKRTLDVVHAVAQGVVVHSHAAFFDRLLDKLTTALEVEHAFIGELQTGTGRIRVVAGKSPRAPALPFEYELTGTPCENVVGKSLCCYEDHAAAQFPLDQQLTDWGIRGYVGTPLVDSQQRPLGLIFLLSGKPLQQHELIVSLLQIVATRVANELERMRTEAELRQLAGRLLRLQDTERRMLGRELHDTTAQGLAALEINLATLGQHAGRLPPGVRRVLRDASELASRSASEIRTLAYSLRPPLLDELGLVPALRVLVQGFARRSGIHCQFRASHRMPSLGSDNELALYRVAQEALANVHRHSGSGKAEIKLSRTRACVRLTIKDYGRGVPRSAQKALTNGRISSGLGLGGMQERMRQLGGGLSLQSSQRGTRIIATLPCRPRAH